MPKLIDITGQTFGRLTAIEQVGTPKYRKNALWRCRCECGNEKIAARQDLRRGHIRSCGCLRKEAASLRFRTHGQTGTRLFKCWDSMRQRCRNPRDHAYPRYGGRGIVVDPAWDHFEAFRDWAMANGYAANLSIDRIDNDGNYEPANCQWISKAEQNRNKSNLRPVIRSDGERFATVADAARSVSRGETTIQGAINRNGRSAGYGWRYE